MMEDHELLSSARNSLADALKALLKTEIMTAADFQRSRNHVHNAARALDYLLRQSHRDPAQP